MCIRDREFLAYIRLEDIPDLKVVVAGEFDAAFEAGFYFLDVVLDAFEGFDGDVLCDDHAAARQADSAAALDVAVGDEAAGDAAHPADLEHLPHLGMPVQFLAHFGFEHARQGLLEIVEDLVDDLIEPNLSLIHISEPTRQAEISYAVFCLKKKKQ